MKVTSAKTMWPEPHCFRLVRENIGNQYIFLHFHSPVKIHTDSGVVLTEGNTFMIINKFGYQNFEVVENTMTHDWMHIEGNLDNIMAKAGLSYNKIYNISDGAFITKSVHDIELEMTGHDIYSDGIIENDVKKLLLLIGRAVNGNISITEPKIRDAILSARSAIHRRYDMDWNIDAMANIVHMSRSRFSELYTQIIGISPKKDLQNVRIEHAKYMLSTSNLTVKSISKAIGYDTEYYFIRKFKDITGMTPGEYRQEERKVSE